MNFQKEKELLVRGILTNSLNNNIYSWKSNPEPEVLDIISKFSKEDPESLGKALLLNEKYGVLKNMKYYILGALGFTEQKSYFKETFPRVIKDIEDIFSFANILRNKGTDRFFLKLSGLRVNMLRDKLSKITESEFLPYFTRPRKSGQMNLKDLAILLHAKSLNPFLQQAINSLFIKNGKIDALEHELPRIWALKKIEIENNPSEIIQLIEKYNLKWDWVIPRLRHQDPGIWAALILRLTPAEIIDRIGSYIRHECLSVSYVEDLLVSKIKAAALEDYQVEDPFRIYLAWRNLDHSAPLNLFNAIANLMNQSAYLDFVGISEANTAVFLDISESMDVKRTGDNILDYIHRPTILECAVMHSLFLLNAFPEEKRKLYLYSEEITEPRPAGSMIEMLNMINTARRESSSDITLPLRELLRSKSHYDYIFIFTDYDYDSRLADLWREYRNGINQDGNLFLIHLTPFIDDLLDFEKGFYRILEWNDRTARLIVNVINYRQHWSEYENESEDISKAP